VTGISSPAADGRANAVVDRRAGRVLFVDRAGKALPLFPRGLASLLRRHGVDVVGDGRAPVPEMGL